MIHDCVSTMMMPDLIASRIPPGRIVGWCILFLGCCFCSCVCCCSACFVVGSFGWFWLVGRFVGWLVNWLVGCVVGLVWLVGR